MPTGWRSRGDRVAAGANHERDRANEAGSRTSATERPIERGALRPSVHTAVLTAVNEVLDRLRRGTVKAVPR